MHNRMAVLLGSLAVVACGSSSAFAQQILTPLEDPNLNRYPISGPYELTGPVMSTESSLLYSNTTETGSRFNAGTGGDPFGSGSQQDVTFDDIPIPNARLGGATMIDVTRVTVGIRRAGNAPEVDVQLFWSTLTTTVSDPDTELDVPFFAAGTKTLAARNTGSFITELVSFGDGTSTLFTAPLNTTIFDGFGTFLLGIQFSNGDNLNGWRLTSGSDLNANAMWIFDSDVANPEGVYNFGAGAPAATFYITVEGTAVPEPASLSLLAGCSTLLLRRRR